MPRRRDLLYPLNWDWLVKFLRILRYINNTITPLFQTWKRSTIHLFNIIIQLIFNKAQENWVCWLTTNVDSLSRRKEKIQKIFVIHKKYILFSNLQLNYFLPHSYLCKVLAFICNNKLVAFSKEGWARESSKTEYFVSNIVTCPGWYKGVALQYSKDKMAVTLIFNLWKITVWWHIEKIKAGEIVSQEI